MSLKHKDQIWNGTEDLKNSASYQKNKENEFFNLPILNEMSKTDSSPEQSTGASRRDFLKYVGFSVGAAAVAASCETPVRKAIPYVTKPDAIVPGVATYYASSFFQGGYFCPVLVKTREGRPIKIEGNALASSYGGGTSARVQASVLDLYDQSRFKQPKVKSGDAWEDADWNTVDGQVMTGLKGSNNIRIVTHTIISPSYKKAIAEFKTQYPSTEVVTYDPVSSSAILMAAEKDFGKAIIPGYRFDKADYIVSFGADLLGTWISPVEFAHQVYKNRKIKKVEGAKMNKLVVVEPSMSLTGSNADEKVLIRPSEQGLAIATLYNLLGAGPKVNVNSSFSNPKAEAQLARIAGELKRSKASIIVSDSNNTTEQQLINRINQTLNNYGKTIKLDQPIYVKQGLDKNIVQFSKDLAAGKVDAVLFLDDANPIYDSPVGGDIAANLGKAKLVVSCTNRLNETAQSAGIVAPVDHYLESWADAEPRKGYFAMVQPTIERLFDTRSAAESLLVWSGHSLSDKIKAKDGEERGYYQFIKSVWESELFAQQNQYHSFQSFWDNSVHDGFCDAGSTAAEVSLSVVGQLTGKVTEPSSAALELKVFESVGMGNGIFANNPWLQEMPDPITRVVWDNTLQIPLHWDGRDEFKVYNDLTEDGSLVGVSIHSEELTLPTIQQFGQQSNTVATALGFGRTVCGKAGLNVGVNLFPLLTRDSDDNIQYFLPDVSVSGKKGEDDRFAMVQYHHTMGVRGEDEDEGGKTINVDEKSLMHFFTGFQGSLTNRTIIRHSTLGELDHKVEALKEERAHAHHLNEQTMYPSYDYQYKQGHHWGMSVDLTSCIGCAACQVACVAENNVPIVGKTEVNRHHEMTWMRIDRYYYGEAENPSVVYQPMMCQHCDNAPCENVCPVAATNHSSEGLNQMAYNRCVGTRYCANNCPYKVRRFNWLDYTTADLFPVNESNPFGEDESFYTDNLVRMVLNPDVTVRSRGVIEKCSMCVQRIQEGKLKAKVERRALKDGEIKTACQTACPTGAIVFGDMNDKDSELSQQLDSPLTYYALEEVNTRSSIGYKMKVLNRPAENEIIES